MKSAFSCQKWRVERRCARYEKPQMTRLIRVSSRELTTSDVIDGVNPSALIASRRKLEAELRLL